MEEQHQLPSRKFDENKAILTLQFQVECLTQKLMERESQIVLYAIEIDRLYSINEETGREMQKWKEQCLRLEELNIENINNLRKHYEDNQVTTSPENASIIYSAEMLALNKQLEAQNDLIKSLEERLQQSQAEISTFIDQNQQILEWQHKYTTLEQSYQEETGALRRE